MADDEPLATRWTARGEHEIPADGDWLTPHERDRAAGMRFTKRRTEYLLRRLAGKHAVAAAAGLPAEPASLRRIEIANLPTGAPVVLVDGAPAEVGVSLTDRAGWAVCLVAPAAVSVGCDLEVVEPRSPGFVADFLTPAEQRWVASLPDADRDVAANLLWSAKESALKVLRTGLSRDTRTVEVTVAGAAGAGAGARGGGAGGWAALRVDTPEGRRMTGWWRRDGVFVLTVAAEAPLAPPARLAGAAELRDARPVHSWVAQPLAP